MKFTNSTALTFLIVLCSSVLISCGKLDADQSALLGSTAGDASSASTPSPVGSGSSDPGAGAGTGVGGGGSGGGLGTGGGSGAGTGSGTGGSGGVTDFKLSCYEAKFVAEINLYRKSLGLGVLKVSKSGVLSARWHAQNMIDLKYFSHYEPNGRSPFERMNSFGFPGLAENASYGSSSMTPFCQWYTSPGHDENMRGRNYTIVSIGRAVIGSMAYWSNGFATQVNDVIQEPLTNESGCVLPTTVPSCVK